jgi:hypothetical protein
LSFREGVTLLIFGGSVALLKLERQFGLRHLERQGTDVRSGLGAVEGAVFALMGLLLAFVISRKLQRFDERRRLILQEVNAINTAADRLFLLDRASQEKPKPKFKAYVEGRLALYEIPIGFSVIDEAVVYSPEAVRVAASRKKDL